MGNFGRFFRHAGCQWEERRGEEREWGRLADRRLKEMRLVGEVRGDGLRCPEKVGVDVDK